MKKKIFVILILFIVSIFIVYKVVNLGNNTIKSDNVDILNISSYEAEVTVEVHSNKNTNKYIMKQTYKKPNYFSQEIVEPSQIKGLTITNDGEKVTIKNKRLESENIYENFNGNISNLSLISFINQYQNGEDSKEEETEKEIIMKTKIEKSHNKYQMYQNLYINKETKLPTKMEILDINKNISVYILYNEIKINQEKV